MKQRKVCVTIVTYNRIDYLKNLLESLIDQSYKIDSILLVDNFSSDSTKNEILEIGYSDSNEENTLLYKKWNSINCYYYRNNENTGGSGGFAKAFELVENIDCDYLWVMDDDVYPENNCLENLIKYMDTETKICIPNRTFNGFQDRAITKLNLSNPLKYGTKGKTYETNFTNQEYIYVVDMPFEGPLISIDIVNKIKYPDKDYFIIYDDTDYAYRALTYTKIKFIPAAILKKMIIPTIDKKRTMNWKDYYSYRNCITFARKYGQNIFVKILTPFVLWFDLALRAVYRRKFYNFKVINKAFVDGVKNNRGKTVNPGEL